MENQLSQRYKNNATDLDERLRELALTEWNTFVQLIGEENITSAKICLLRRDNVSYGAIQMKLKNVNKNQIAYRAKDEKCLCKVPDT